MEDIGHEHLEARIRDTCHLLRAIEIFCGSIPTLLALAHIVDKILGHLAQCPALLPEVDADACSSILCCLDALLDGVRQIGPARANVRAKHVAAIALIMDPHSELHRLIWDLLGITPDVDRHAANWRQEKLQVLACKKLRVHGVRLLEDRLAQLVFGHAETFRNAREVPHRFDGSLGDKALPLLCQHSFVGLQAAGIKRLPALRELDVRFGDCDGRTNVIAPVQPWSEALRDGMAIRINGHDPLRVVPRSERTDPCHGCGQAKLGHVCIVELVAHHSQGAVNGVTS
mmetsp:Transcript_91701/g.230452  ORF Transcript_91701/g.230452 Transcript_91701/m.230452 type:complete len:286 (-) Transcript_91701:329-1186(-)